MFWTWKDWAEVGNFGENKMAFGDKSRRSVNFEWGFIKGKGAKREKFVQFKLDFDPSTFTF